jgi:predicted amidophosphoribosyltransferase
MYDDPDDWEDDEEGDESEVVPCPACGADVYEDAERCPACGEYIVHSTSPWRDRPRWWIVVGLLGIAAVIYSLVHWRL